VSQKLVKKAFAKLDLGIYIDPQRSKEGLFPVSYLVCQLDIADELSFEKTRAGIEIVCEYPGVPKNEENFIYKAAVLLKELSGKPDFGARIILKKRIPVKAGFGGGSSDGAAAIIGLSKLWNIDVTQAKLLDFSRKLGKDFYYSLYGGLLEIESVGRNYKKTEIDGGHIEFWTVVLVPVLEKPSTGWIYEHLNREKIGKNFSKFKKLRQALLLKDKANIMANLLNDFENSVVVYYPMISKMKQDLADAGASGKLMAGAGLSVVGFFDTRNKAESAALRLKKNPKYRQVLVSKTIF
jgi:4-diphosphocytidyl-2-C-methyl-D-erythritol kinase